MKKFSMSTCMNDVARKLRIKLQEKHISAHALEKLAGLRPSIVHNILQGKSKNPTAQTLQAISHALGCGIDELLDNSPTAKPLTNDWNPDLYEEATIIVNQLITAKKLKVSKEKALNYIEEIYNYAIKGKNKHIDKQFADWLIDKDWF